MNRPYKKVSQELKTQILSQAIVPGCVIADLAKKHGISPKTIHNWKRVNNNFKIFRPQQIKASNKFVELTVKDQNSSTIKKASLEFNDFSLAIEGKIKNSILVSILKILD